MEKIIIYWERGDGFERTKPIEIRVTEFLDASLIFADIMDLAMLDDGDRKWGRC